ncbi:MAG: glycosyltransferase involved in cell wall biosynthesis [Candidatus Azotimanducaceae bacterium]|jgi:glycosyltransferase involved in cell wall biosynthesis
MNLPHTYNNVSILVRDIIGNYVDAETGLVWRIPMVIKNFIIVQFHRFEKTKLGSKTIVPIVRKIMNLPQIHDNLKILAKDKTNHTGKETGVKRIIFTIAMDYLMILVRRFSKTKIGLLTVYPFMPKLGDFSQYQAKKCNLDASASDDTYTSTNCPKLSIVTPSFQQGDYIEKTILSVVSQKYPNLQYVIQDGGSKDATVSILKKYADELFFWESASDGGQTNALNLGFHRTDGEIMAYVNSDDLLLPNSIRRVIDYFNSHPEVEVIYGNRLLIDPNDDAIGEWILHGHDEDVLSYADYVPQETMFWRRSVWERSGGTFNEQYRFAMDWDLILRFREAKAHFVHLPFVLGAFRIHPLQKTSAVIDELGQGEMQSLRLRELGHQPPQAEIRKKVLPFLMRHIWADFKYRYLNWNKGYR